MKRKQDGNLGLHQQIASRKLHVATMSDQYLNYRLSCNNGGETIHR